MPAYARVVGANPPFAYERAKTAAATAIPTAASRRSAFCSPFTLIQAKARYSIGVFGGLNRLLVAALVAGVFFVAPSAAFACGGDPSAVNVYTPCVPTGGGGKSGGGTSAHGGPSTSAAISPRAALALKRAGKDRRVLASLVKGYGVRRPLENNASSSTAGGPTALGSALDLASGPTALLIVLAGTALLLLGGSGMRSWRSRHRS
jgi:hypothetical protein